MARPAAQQTTVEVNGFAVRAIRVLTGPSVDDVAAQVGVTRSYLTKIELGTSTRVSPRVFAALVGALDIKDRRAILATPHVDAATKRKSA